MTRCQYFRHEKYSYRTCHINGLCRKSDLQPGRLGRRQRPPLGTVRPCVSGFRREKMFSTRPQLRISGSCSNSPFGGEQKRGLGASSGAGGAIVVTTCFKPKYKLPVHLNRQNTVRNRELGKCICKYTSAYPFDTLVSGLGGLVEPSPISYLTCIHVFDSPQLTKGGR